MYVRIHTGTYVKVEGLREPAGGGCWNKEMLGMWSVWGTRCWACTGAETQSSQEDSLPDEEHGILETAS